MRNTLVLAVILLSFIIIASLSACTGSSISHEPSAKDPAPKGYVKPADTERLQTGGAFSINPTDERGNPRPDLTQNFELKVLENKDTTIIEVYAVDFKDADWVFFSMNYNPNMFKPRNVDFTDFMGGPGDVISLAITGYWKYVDVGIVRTYFDKRPGVDGSGLICRIVFDNTPFGERRYVAKDPQNPANDAPTGDPNRVSLSVALVDGKPQLTWRERNIGDGDNSGEVGIPDITPIALNYNDTLPNPSKPWLEIVDYDANGEVGIPDITPIALRYLTNLTGYQVSTSTNGVNFTPVTSGATVTRATINPAPKTSDGRLQYVWNAPALPAEDTFYRVAPVAANGNIGTNSNVAQFQTSQPIQSVRIINPLVGDPGLGIDPDPNALPLIVTETSRITPGAAEGFARPQVQLRAYGLPVGAAQEIEVTDQVLWDIELHDQVAMVGNSSEDKGLVTGTNRGFAVVRAMSPFDFQVKATFTISCATIQSLDMTTGGSTNPINIAAGAEVPFQVLATFSDGYDPDPGTPGDETPDITGVNITPYVGWLHVQNTVNPVNFIFRTDGTLLTTSPGIQTGDWVRVFCQYPAEENPVIAFGFVATSNPIQVNFN